MKCDVCKDAEAKVHLTQIVNGVMQKIDLCEGCSKEKGVTDPAGFSFADLLLGASQENAANAQPLASGELHCSGCGMTQSDFKKSGRLGCAQCYDTFTDGLAPLLKGMHKGEQHVGKIPPSHIQNMAYGERLKLLKRDLDRAVKSESFEQAAELRDKIRKLEQEGKATS